MQRLNAKKLHVSICILTKYFLSKTIFKQISLKFDIINNFSFHAFVWCNRKIQFMQFLHAIRRSRLLSKFVVDESTMKFSRSSYAITSSFHCRYVQWMTFDFSRQLIFFTIIFSNHHFHHLIIFFRHFRMQTKLTCKFFVCNRIARNRCECSINMQI